MGELVTESPARTCNYEEKVDLIHTQSVDLNHSVATTTTQFVDEDPLTTHCEMEGLHSAEGVVTLDEPDNELHTEVGECKEKVDREISLNLSSALRTPMFWALAAGGCSVEMYWCGLNFHLLRVLQSSEADLTSTQIAHLQTITSICAVVASVVAGIAFDYIERKQLLLVAGLVCGAASIVVLLNFTTIYQAWLFGALFGIMAGQSVGR